MREKRQWLVALFMTTFSALAYAGTPDHMLGCYSLEAGGKPEIRFALEEGQIT